MIDIPGLTTDTDQPHLDETATATFSPCRRYRYALTRTWDPKLPPVVWIMLNPSTADAFTVDPTITRCMGFARQWGAGGIVAVNLFAFRSTDPRALRQRRDPVGPHNDQVIAHYIRQPRRAVVAAWGTSGNFRERDKAVLNLLEQHDVEVACLKTTRDGHPWHPLYVPADAQPIAYQPCAEVAS